MPMWKEVMTNRTIGSQHPPLVWATPRSGSSVRAQESCEDRSWARLRKDADERQGRRNPA